MCNSQNHPIDLLSGTIAFVHVALLPDSLLPTTPSSSPASQTPIEPSKTAAGETATKLVACKFRSQADRWGRAYVRVAGYVWTEEEATQLEDAVEALRENWGKALGGWGL